LFLCQPNGFFLKANIYFDVSIGVLVDEYFAVYDFSIEINTFVPVKEKCVFTIFYNSFLSIPACLRMVIKVPVGKSLECMGIIARFRVSGCI